MGGRWWGNNGRYKCIAKGFVGVSLNWINQDPRSGSGRGTARTILRYPQTQAEDRYCWSCTC